MGAAYSLRRWGILSITVGFTFMASNVAQAQSGSLQGQVVGPFDGRVANAPMRVLHIDSGDSWRTSTDENGRYEFSTLPAGDIRVQVRVRCCEYMSYQSELVELRSDDEHIFDIRLEQGFQLNTLGDDVGIATAQILANQNIPDLPIPRTTDGRPILTGMWMYGDDPFPPTPALHDWAAELVQERTASQFIESPRIRCLPTSLPIPTHTPPIFGKFLQTPGLIALLYEGVLGYRQIFTDGRSHPEDPDPSWLGHSIGSWEGDVLVVHTVGFNDRGWTGLAHPRSEQFQVTERYRRTSYGEMALELTIEDPEVYQEPWVRQIPVYLAPNEELLEYVCENEAWLESIND